MPTLSEVLNTFPNGQFLVNFKSNIAKDGHALTRLLETNSDWKAQIAGVYGGHKPVMAVVDASGTIPGYSKVTIKSCLSKYIAVGWSGIVPADCKNTLVAVPINHAPFLWGWPLRFQDRLHHVGSKIILSGPVEWGKVSQNGFDDRKTLDAVPKGFSGYIWTNRIELLGAGDSALPL